MCDILLPLRIICRNQGSSPQTMKIRGDFVEIVRTRIPQIPPLTLEEKNAIAALCPDLQKVEPTLAGEVMALLEK